MALAIYSLVASVALGTPDFQLHGHGAGLKLPFADTEIGFLAFILIGPLVLMALAAYVHLFIGQLKHPVFDGDKKLHPAVVTIRSPAGRLITWLWVYALSPALVFGFAYKALPREEFTPIVVGFARATLLASIWLQIRRCPREWRRFAVPPLSILLFATLGAAGYYGYDAADSEWIPITRQSTITKSELVTVEEYKRLGRLNSSNLRFTGGDWSYVNLSDVVLDSIDMSGQNLRMATLAEAYLADANLSEANPN